MRFALVTLAITLACLVTGQPRRINVTVYVTSMCRDSQRFIPEQLVPFYQRFKDYVNVEFVPWGRSKYVNGAIVCQFGPEDCFANRVQRCALNLMRDQDSQVDYMNCEYSTLASTKGDLHCASRLPIEYMDQCLQLWDTESEAAGRTIPLDLQFIPSIAIDGVYEPKLSKRLFEKFESTMCEIMQPYFGDVCT